MLNYGYLGLSVALAPRCERRFHPSGYSLPGRLAGKPALDGVPAPTGLRGAQGRVVEPPGPGVPRPGGPTAPMPPGGWLGSGAEEGRGKLR